MSELGRSLFLINALISSTFYDAIIFPSRCRKHCTNLKETSSFIGVYCILRQGSFSTFSLRECFECWKKREKNEHSEDHSEPIFWNRFHFKMALVRVRHSLKTLLHTSFVQNTNRSSIKRTLCLFSIIFWRGGDLMLQSSDWVRPLSRRFNFYKIGDFYFRPIIQTQSLCWWGTVIRSVKSNPDNKNEISLW